MEKLSSGGGVRVCLVIVNAKVALSFPREEKTVGRKNFFL